MAAESFLVESLSDLVGALNSRGVEYALAGGWAYSALIEPRATTDIDLLILVDQPSQGTIQALLSSVFDSIVVHQTPMRFRGISIWRAIGIRRGQEVVVDLLLADSEYLRVALARRQSIPFGVGQVSILTVEDLIVLKSLAGRLQDLADLEKIQTRREALRVDWAYVEEWKTKLGLEKC